MRELITFSLGPLSNFTSAHFWNFQDEWLKQDGAAANPVLYYETERSRIFIPRSVFVDFRPHFGNYLSSFSHPQPAQEEIDTWKGSLTIKENDRLPLSSFQRELDILDEQSEDDEEEEKVNRDEDEDEDEEDKKEKFKEIMQSYKAAGGKGDSLMQMMMQQMK